MKKAKNLISIDLDDQKIYKKFIKVKNEVYKQLNKIRRLSYSKEEIEDVKVKLYKSGLKKALYKSKTGKDIFGKLETETISDTLIGKLQKEENEIYIILVNYLLL